MRINKLEIVISAVLAAVFGIVSFISFGNETVFTGAMILTELSLFAFMAMYITYVVPDKNFNHA